MRTAYALFVLVLGFALVGAVQWAADGLAGLPVAVPASWSALVPFAAFLLFGVYLAVVFGGSPGPAVGILGALVGLVVAGLPLLYQYGIAQQYGLPADAGTFGALYTGALARSAAALWVPVGIVSAFRRTRPAGVRLPLPAARPASPSASEAATPPESAPFWTPAPALRPAEPAAVAYTPDDSRRA